MILLVLQSCSDSSKEEKTKSPAVKSNMTCFQKEESFSVLKFEANKDHPSSGNIPECLNADWTLTERQIEQIIKESEAIAGTDWDLLFEHLPCQVTGTLMQKEQQFNFKINSGCWLWIACGDSTLMFGSFKKETMPLFLSVPDTISHPLTF